MAEIIVEFSAGAQSLGALQAAAYRLIGTGSCHIQAVKGGYACVLSAEQGEPDSIRHRFLDLVTDENLRERLDTQTGRTRDLLLALAFGGLAAEAEADTKDRAES